MRTIKQKLLIEYLLSSGDLFARCGGIIKPEFFDLDFRPAVASIFEYYEKYHKLPDFDKVEAETDLRFSKKEVDATTFVWACNQIEEFAKNSAVAIAIKDNLNDVNNGIYGGIMEQIKDAINITLDRDVGIDLYENTEENLLNAVDSLEYMSTGIQELDHKLKGIARKQFTLFSANSGVGKSIMMSNIGDNMSIMGRHVCYISFELDQDMILTRLAAISTGESIDEWQTHITQMAQKIEAKKKYGVGSYVIKRLPNGSTANDVRSYLKQYVLVHKRNPDVIIIDYLDLMHPNGGVKSLSISEQDKLKSEQLYEVGVEYNAAILSASQQNRSGVQNASPDQTVIAGGFNKINIVDNYISLAMTPEMRLEGTLLLHYLKTRSASAIGSVSQLAFNPSNLQITDTEDKGKVKLNAGLMLMYKNAMKQISQADRKSEQEININSAGDKLLDLMSSLQL